MDWKDNGSKVKLSRKEVLWSVFCTVVAIGLIGLLKFVA
jgi:hypothetical protein